MATKPKQRTKENIEEEFDTLQLRGFDLKTINLIFQMEDKLGRFIYDMIPAIPKKMEYVQLQRLADKVAKDNVSLQVFPLLIGAARRNVDLDKINTDQTEEIVKTEIELVEAGLNPKQYIKDGMVTNDAKLVLSLFASGMDLANFDIEKYETAQYGTLESLVNHSSKKFKENLSKIFTTDISINQISWIANAFDLNKNDIDLALCNKDFKKEHIQVLAKELNDGTKKEILKDLFDPALKPARMETMIYWRKKGIDIEDLFDSKFPEERIDCIAKLRKNELPDKDLLNPEIDSRRAKMIYNVIVSDNLQYDYSIFTDIEVPLKLANAIYLLTKNGYKVEKPAKQINIEDEER